MVSWNVTLYSVIFRHQVLGNPVAPLFPEDALGTCKPLLPVNQTTELCIQKDHNLFNALRTSPH